MVLQWWWSNDYIRLVWIYIYIYIQIRDIWVCVCVSVCDPVSVHVRMFVSYLSHLCLMYCPVHWVMYTRNGVIHVSYQPTVHVVRHRKQMLIPKGDTRNKLLQQHYWTKRRLCSIPKSKEKTVTMPQSRDVVCRLQDVLHKINKVTQESLEFFKQFLL